MGFLYMTQRRQDTSLTMTGPQLLVDAIISLLSLSPRLDFGHLQSTIDVSCSDCTFLNATIRMRRTLQFTKIHNLACKLSMPRLLDSHIDLTAGSRTQLPFGDVVLFLEMLHHISIAVMWDSCLQPASRIPG